MWMMLVKDSPARGYWLPKGNVHLKFSGHTIALLRNLMSNLGQILHVKRFFVTETGSAKVEVL